MRPKITPKENLSCDTEWEWHSRAPRQGGTVPKLLQKHPNTGQAALVCPLAQPDSAIWHGRATWLPPQLLVPVSVVRLVIVVRSIGTSMQRLFTA